MIIWNFNTPITFVASCIWNLSEFIRIPLPRPLDKWTFDTIMEQKGNKQ